MQCSLWYDNGVCQESPKFAFNTCNCAQRVNQHLHNGTSWSGNIWRGSHCTVAYWHAVHLGRAGSGYQSLSAKSISKFQAKLGHRSVAAPQALLVDRMTDTAEPVQTSASTPTPVVLIPPKQLKVPLSPAKFADWGIYNYKAVVAYDGTAYKGFQLQRGECNTAPTIQGVLERVLCQIRQESRETLRMQSSGRTDAGVHAKGQVINFYSHKLTPDCTAMMTSLARMLPDDVSVLSMQRVPPDFHARFTNYGKVYHYHATVASKVDPFTRLYSGRVQGPLNLALMRQAAKLFIGQHDFTHFANVGNPDPSPVKTIRRFEVLPSDTGFVFQVEGSGFMYKMVRHMVGALLSVGAGTLSPDIIAERLALGKTQIPGEKYRGWKIAEAQGLFLMEVMYPAHDDSTVLCHPDIEHDAYGRPLVGSHPGEG